MTATGSPLLRWTGFALGALLTVGLLLAGRMPQSSADAPARISIASQPTTELGVDPAGAKFLAARRLLPGSGAARGKLTLANYAGGHVDFRLRVANSDRDLDHVVRIRVSQGRRRVFDGRLGELRTWSRKRVVLRQGQSRDVEFRAWLPMSVQSGYQGRSADLELEWKKASS